MLKSSYGVHFAVINSMVFISEGNTRSDHLRLTSIVRASASQLRSTGDSMPNNGSKLMPAVPTGSPRKAWWSFGTGTTTFWRICRVFLAIFTSMPKVWRKWRQPPPQPSPFQGEGERHPAPRLAKKAARHDSAPARDPVVARGLWQDRGVEGRRSRHQFGRDRRLDRRQWRRQVDPDDDDLRQAARPIGADSVRRPRYHGRADPRDRSAAHCAGA